ncbi:MAG: glutamine-synthetase adenylyltransferase, partial [Paracoccaceae bacterium]|nr:glutamine-synthetase adenylyltransferase [Paracoccaceae bacterium]
GEAAIGAEVEAFRRLLLAEKSTGATVIADVADMRARLRAAKPVASAWEAKDGAGRLMDVELLAQTAALLAGSPARRIEVQLHAGVTCGWLDPAAERAALAAYRLCWQLRCGSKLLSDGALDLASVGEGGTAFLLRETGAPDVATLAARLDGLTAGAAVVIDAALRGDDDGETSNA